MPHHGQATELPGTEQHLTRDKVTLLWVGSAPSAPRRLLSSEECDPQPRQPGTPEQKDMHWPAAQGHRSALRPGVCRTFCGLEVVEAV